MKTGVFITTYGRPAFALRTLKSVLPAAKEINAEVLLVEDGEIGPFTKQSDEYQNATNNIFMFQTGNPENWASGAGDPKVFKTERNFKWLRNAENRGLACAMNLGLSFFLADPSIEVIHMVQDDCDIDPLAFAACNFVLENRPDYLVTGHDAREHHQKPHSQVVDAPYGVGLIKARTRPSCRATHMAMTRKSWESLMPIPSRGLGLPKPGKNGERGMGSNADWWCVRDSKNAKPVLAVPGLVRTFAWKGEESCWGNTQVAGEDGPLNRNSISEWIKNR